jgi:hypothetical protein
VAGQSPRSLDIRRFTTGGLWTIIGRLSVGGRRSLPLVLALIGWASPVNGQILERPERASRPPARTSQELRLALNSLGGYDNPALRESGGLDVLTLQEPGYTGFADAALRYARTREGRSFELGGRAYLNSFGNVGLKPSYGGDLHSRVKLALGRRHELNLSAAGSSDPLHTLGAFGSLRGDVGPGVTPDANSANGSSTRRSQGYDASATLVSHWSPRNTLSSTYRRNARDFRDDIGDSGGHSWGLDFTRSIGRRSGLRAAYRGSASETRDLDGLFVPMNDHAAELGYQQERQVSRTRRWSFSFGAGATHVETLRHLTHEPWVYVVPSGYGSTRIDIGRSWNVSADYRRSVTVLEGLTAASFVTDAALLRTGGFVGPRAELVFSTGYANGATAAADSFDTFDSYTASAQLRLIITGSLSAVVSQSYYTYALNGALNLPVGFPRQLDRNSVRVGLTFDLPLYASYARRPSRPNEGN